VLNLLVEAGAEPQREKRVGLKIVRDPPSLKIESVTRRPTCIDGIPLEHDRVMTRSRDGQRGREPRDAASGDDELHVRKVTVGVFT
jgi:hypothetical protein